MTLVPVLPGALSDGQSSSPVVAATTFDEEMPSVGELAHASLVEVFVSSLAAAGHRRFVHVGGSDQYASARTP